MTEQEKWKPVSGYLDLYEVSTLGRVRSLDRYVKGRPGQSMAFKKGTMLKLKRGKDGFRVGLYDQGQKFYFVHRLVAQSFIPNPENKDCVIHINFDVYDNYVTNLLWATRAEVQEIAKYSQRLSGKIYQLNNHRSKPVELDGKTYPSQSECARENNFNLCSLNHAISRRYGYSKTNGIFVPPLNCYKNLTK